MRSRRTILLAAAALAVALINTALLYEALREPGGASVPPSLAPRGSQGNHTAGSKNIYATVTIYVNGKKVLSREDPVTKHWLTAMIGSFFWENCGGLTFLTESGAQSYGLDTGYVMWSTSYGRPLTGSTTGYIEIGTGSQQATPLVYKLASLLTRVKPQNGEVTENDYWVNVTLRATYQVSSDTDITEIGYSVYGDYDTGRYASWDYLLVAYYALQSPIHLAANDSITVVYTFHLKKTEPFTRNFWNAVAYYGLGLQGLGYGRILYIYDTSGNSIGFDTFYCNCQRSQEAVYDPYGFTQVQPVNAYNIGDNTGAVTDDMIQVQSACTYTYDSTKNQAAVTLRLAWDIVGNKTVHGVAVYQKWSDTTTMVGYFPFRGPVEVNNKGLSVVVTAYLEGSNEQ